jgi:nucleoid-associated protein YgaU
VIRAAWVLVAPTVALAALCDPAIAQGKGEDPVRRQAEELAAEASQKFGEVLKGQVPDPTPRRVDEQATEPIPDGTLNVLLYWLDYSEHEYRGIMRRLALEGRGSGWDPVTLSWLKRSSQQFQSIMARLARAGAPAGKWDPVADADKRRLEGTAVPSGPAAAAPGTAPWPTADAHSEGGQAVGAADTRTAATADTAKEAAANPLAEAEARQTADLKAAAEAKAGTQERQEAASAPSVPASEPGKAERAHPFAEAGKAENAERPDAAPRHPEQAKNEPPMPEQGPGATPAEVRAPGAEPAKTGEDLEEPEARPTEPAHQLAQAASGAAATEGGAPTNSTAEPATVPAASAPSQRRVSQIARAAVPKVGLRKVAGRTGLDRCKSAGASVQLPGWYVVKKGDTLWAIAERHYGAGARYRRIYEANRDRLRRGPDWILPCQHLYLPRQGRKA